MSGHFPGPYKVEDFCDVDSVDINISVAGSSVLFGCVFFGDDGPVSKEQAIATATLFAGSDELLSVCQEIAECLRYNDQFNAATTLHDRLLKAISKATGGS